MSTRPKTKGKLELPGLRFPGRSFGTSGKERKGNYAFPIGVADRETSMSNMLSSYHLKEKTGISSQRQRFPDQWLERWG